MGLGLAPTGRRPPLSIEEPVPLPILWRTESAFARIAGLEARLSAGLTGPKTACYAVAGRGRPSRKWRNWQTRRT
jgi:hypothetical protein